MQLHLNMILNASNTSNNLLNKFITLNSHACQRCIDVETCNNGVPTLFRINLTGRCIILINLHCICKHMYWKLITS